jgi:cytochrome c553
MPSLANTPAPAAPAKAVAAKPDLAAGEARYTAMCAACHGADGNSGSPAYPKLAGQHADYLFATLRAYGTEGNPQVGRANAVMSGQVKQFKRAELKAIAEYLSSLPGDLRVVNNPKFK